jgi:hypothetical protein
MSNPLDPIIAWYTTAKDSIRVTRRVIATSIAGAVTNKHVFHGKAATDNEAALDQAQEELDRLVVLGLVAIFERSLRDHLFGLPVVAAATGVALHDRVRDELLKDMEFWNISSRVIELFAVDAALRGQVKQIIDYRNWVARTNPKSAAPDRYFSAGRSSATHGLPSASGTRWTVVLSDNAMLVDPLAPRARNFSRCSRPRPTKAPRCAFRAADRRPFRYPDGISPPPFKDASHVRPHHPPHVRGELCRQRRSWQRGTGC